MKKYILSAFLVLLTASTAGAALHVEELTYQAGDDNLTGYLAYDDAIEGKRPGILVVHEWWGHNAYARSRAERLAKLGYVALALDMYGDGKTTDHPDTAGEFSGAVMASLSTTGKARFMAALEQLKTHEMTDPEKIAAIGYCFGGGVVLNMARMGVDLDGVVSFHGSLGAKVAIKPGDVKAKVLVCNGADDTFVSPESITAFKQEMGDAGVDYRFANYPGAVHSFTNPGATELGVKFGLPLAYNEAADKASWQAMQDFFKDIFK